jgi:molecular chaperone HtpG
LNVSRETVQATGLMARLKKVVTGQVMKELESLAKKDSEKYQTFWKEFGAYLKQGVATSPTEAESITPLLRFKTNLHPEAWSSLEDYVGRMKPDQKLIYFIVGDDPKSILRSPHLDYFQAQGTEVLLSVSHSLSPAWPTQRARSTRSCSVSINIWARSMKSPRKFWS